MVSAGNSRALNQAKKCKGLEQSDAYICQQSKKSIEKGEGENEERGERGQGRGKRRGGNKCVYCGLKDNNLIVTMQSIKM